MPITPEDRKAYVDLNLGLTAGDQARAARRSSTRRCMAPDAIRLGVCLQAMGFAEGEQFFTVESQKEYRGDFANVKFRTPNPEVPESLGEAIEVAKEVGGDLDSRYRSRRRPHRRRRVPWQGDYAFRQRQ